MCKKISVLVVVLITAPVFGTSIPILSPGDVIIAVDTDGLVSNSGYPGAEAPPMALDGDSGTKYLNFGGPGSGFIVTPASSSMVRSFTLTTANDVPGRDPATWALYGTNDAIVSLDNSTGLAEAWTLIGEGTVALPDERFTLGPVVTVDNTNLYSSYRMVYPELKSEALMQIADVAFYVLPDGSGPPVLSALDPILAVHTGPDSRYPGAESPPNAIDDDVNTKYLNFGRTNSGFIVTPSLGPSILDSFQITTANDAPGRDPTVWILYGTNDPITSEENSDGAGETWTPIDAGFVSLPDERFTPGPMTPICGQDDMFTSYMMVFHQVKAAEYSGTDNSMQIAEIQFYGIPEPATVALLGLGGLALLRIRKRS